MLTALLLGAGLPAAPAAAAPRDLGARVLWARPGRAAVRGLVPGVAGRGRACLVSTCAGLMLAPAAPPHGYRTDAVTDHLVRLVRGPEFATAAPWPDTLVLRLFDEAADQE